MGRLAFAGDGGDAVQACRKQASFPYQTAMYPIAASRHVASSSPTLDAPVDRVDSLVNKHGLTVSPPFLFIIMCANGRTQSLDRRRIGGTSEHGNRSRFPCPVSD